MEKFLNLYDGFGRFEQVTKADGSITHVINGEEKESGELPQEDVQSRVLNYYEYDAFGNTIRCEEQVHNRFRYTGEQYDILTGQYYLRARYYNPVIARFTQEDTYYGDGLNLYTYCQNNPVLYHDPTGHGTKENSPYSRKEQQYIDAGADPDTARLAAECYPDAKSKQDLYNKYKSQGYNATDAKKLANYEIVHGEERAKNYAANNVKKSGPDYTATFPRDNVNTDWRTQERVNAQRNAGAGKGNESGNKSGSKGGTDVRNRQGRPVLATEKTLDMALDPETYANTIAEKYGINLRGSGQSITIKYNADLRPGIYGRTTAANPYVIEIGSDALVSEEELANTIAHELNHARDFIRGGIAPKSSAYSSGNALSDYIMGGR